MEATDICNRMVLIRTELREIILHKHNVQESLKIVQKW